MNRNLFFFGLASLSALVATVAACSSTTITETPVDGGGTTSEAGPGNKDAGKEETGVVDEEDGSTTTDPDVACKQEATLNGCGLCCVTNHQSGYKVFQDALLGCACAGTGADGGAPCATACGATACKSPPAQPDTACNTCLQESVGQTGGCNDAVASACTANADCLAQQKCVSGCQGKPQQ
jgi:hypothetical protein